MESLFDKWKTKIAKYSENHKGLFAAFADKGGAEGEKRVNLGKHFSTQYELYLYAFFLGLYENEYTPIEKGENRMDFSHHIMYWGSKTTKALWRKDFTNLQEYMFMALLAKTEIDFIALEKGELSEDDAVRQLMITLESYTNGGLNLIQDKLNDNPNYFLNPTSFLDLILKNSKQEKSDNMEIDKDNVEFIFSTDSEGDI
jgi:hypothetical protein